MKLSKFQKFPLTKIIKFKSLREFLCAMRGFKGERNAILSPLCEAEFTSDSHEYSRSKSRYLQRGLLISAFITSFAYATTVSTTHAVENHLTNNAASLSDSKPAELINQTVAIVNNGVITQTDLDEALALAKQQIQQSGMPLPDSLSLQRQVLHQLILQKIALQLADLNHVSVADSDVDQEIQHIVSRNNIDIAQLKATLSQEGIDYSNYWQDIRNHLIIRKLEQQAVANNIMISPDEVNNYLAAKAKLANPGTEYHIEHILLPLPSNPTADNLAKAGEQAADIVQQIKSGLPFTKAAMQYSQSDDALQGGDLGWKTADQLPAVFASVVQTMQVGEVIGPIQNDSGFHILTLVDKRTPEVTNHSVTQTHVRDILIKTSPIISNDKAKAMLIDLRAYIVKGNDFAAIAKANSQDLSSMNNGGDMGWLTAEQVDPKFAAVMDNTPVNGISDPFQTKDGWYVIQVLERRQQDDTQDYLRQQAQNYLFQQKVAEALNQWQNTILGDSYVKILVPDLQMPNASQ